MADGVSAFQYGLFARMSESTRGFKISAAASHKTLQASSQHDPGVV
jgi:hypothetical protein